MEDKAHHVIGDVKAQGSSFVVDKGCRVGGKGGQADVQHVVDLRRHGKGCGGEWRLLMLPDVVKFALINKETAETKELCHYHYCLFLYRQTEASGIYKMYLIVI